MSYFTAAVSAAKTMRAKALKAKTTKSKSFSESFAVSNSFYSFSLNNYLNIVKDGCGSLVVRIFGCGPTGPGSTPGRGLLSLFSFRGEEIKAREQYYL